MRAKAGGEGRTRTFEAMRRLIYSQLPLPLGTLPRPTASGNRPPEWRRTEPRIGAESAWPEDGTRSGAFMGKRPCKVNQAGPRKIGQNCQNPEPVTQASHER